MSTKPRDEAIATTNACKMCTPLGACLAFRGIENCVPFLHGSQGCATYIRRYLISHFKEPIDIASSSFDESAAIFGGRNNMHIGLENIITQYHPAVIGVATTCLAETIGEDVGLFLHEFRKAHAGEKLPEILNVSTPAYTGTHADGFYDTTREIVKHFAQPGPRGGHINLLPGMLSPADIRHLRDLIDEFGEDVIVAPDYSDSMDGPYWEEYQLIPEGGTSLHDLRHMGSAARTIELNMTGAPEKGAAAWLEQKFEIPAVRMGIPIGMAATDSFLEHLSDSPIFILPKTLQQDRGRLLDAYVDAHKYVSGKRAVLYGEAELVAAMAGFLAEIGIHPVLCATGGESGRLREAVLAAGSYREAPEIREGVDFHEIESIAEQLAPDIVIGNSKGYPFARRKGIPLVRIGFPIHDRIGAARILHVGYQGAQQLFDRIANALIEAKQDASPVGYMYM